MPRNYKTPITSRVFELVAKTIRAERALPIIASEREIRDVTTENIAYRFSEAFALSNPRFDRDRFFRACGLE